LVPKHVSSASNLKEAIIEALSSLGGCGTISDVKGYIFSKYGKRWKDIGTAMADMCPESTSSLYPSRDRVLRRVGRGEYCLREVKTSNASRAIQRELSEKSSQEKRELSFFSFKNAEDLLRQKGQISTIVEAASLTDLSSQADHDTVQKFLYNKGWNIEISKFPIASYRLDAFKEGTGIEIERSLIDAIHRSLFRCLWSYSKRQLDGLVFIVPTYKEPSFENIKRDIEAFKEVIPFPIYLIGVNLDTR
jgi:hypothetical protein